MADTNEEVKLNNMEGGKDKEIPEIKTLDSAHRRVQVGDNDDVDISTKRELILKFGAEFIAMMLFVFVGCGAAISNLNAGATGAPSAYSMAAWSTGVALAFGTGIMVLVFAIMHISGGHINCAVTLGLWIAGACPYLDALVIVAGQILGSITGAALLAIVYKPENDATKALGSNAVGLGWGYGSAFVGEALMTFLLMFVVLETAVRKRLDYMPSIKLNAVGFNAPIAIGFAVFLAHMVLIRIDGCSINPTRSFGPLIVASIRGLPENSDHWKSFPVVLFGPLVGASVAALLFRFSKLGIERKRSE